MCGCIMAIIGLILLCAAGEQLGVHWWIVLMIVLGLGLIEAGAE